MKIAVCDDSREDRGALRALLEACGHDFEIREYGSGEELYADMGYVRECSIVFLDINMEGMDKAVVLVTHDPHIASYCKKIYFLDEGRVGRPCVRYGNQGDFYDEIMHHMASLQ